MAPRHTNLDRPILTRPGPAYSEATRDTFDWLPTLRSRPALSQELGTFSRYWDRDTLDHDILSFAGSAPLLLARYTQYAGLMAAPNH